MAPRTTPKTTSSLGKRAKVPLTETSPNITPGKVRHTALYGYDNSQGPSISKAASVYIIVSMLSYRLQRG